MNKLVGALVLCMTLITPSIAAQWDPNPETQQFFGKLKNNNGYNCCGFEDGIKDPEYKENEDGSYEVFYDDKWHHAFPETIINPSDRHGVDYAIVWPQPPAVGGRDNIRCFMPGTSF